MKARKVENWVSNHCKTLCIFAILLAVSQISLALGGQPFIDPPTSPSVMQNYSSIKENGNDPLESPRKFERYVKDKYKQISHAESDVKQTSHGPSGRVFILGDIAPQRKPATDLTAEPDRHVRAKAIAKAFMEDEPGLLGITKPEEIREVNILTSKGHNGDYINIYYKRYINDVELEDANLLITLGPSENISGVQAWLVSVPPEVYEATKKKTLSEKEVKSIIEVDITELDKRGLDMNNINKSFKKVAITKYPYVLWKVSYIYDYTIDAFTGKILTKDSGIIPPFKIQQRPLMENPSGIKP